MGVSIFIGILLLAVGLVALGALYLFPSLGLVQQAAAVLRFAGVSFVGVGVFLFGTRLMSKDDLAAHRRVASSFGRSAGSRTSFAEDENRKRRDSGTSSTQKEAPANQRTTTSSHQTIATWPLTRGNVLDAIALQVGDSITQDFEASFRFNGIELTIVTWNHAPSEYSLMWALKNENGITLHSGKLQAEQLSDWQRIYLSAPGGNGKFSLHIYSPLRPEQAAHPVGVVAATPSSHDTPLAKKNSNPLAVPGAIQMWLICE